jgi:predicted O-methyltransferase YrrM
MRHSQPHAAFSTHSTNNIAHMSLVRRLHDRVSFRGGIASQYGASFRRRPVLWTRFVFFDRETTNFTYDLANEHELASWVAEALGCTTTEVAGYLDEIRRDEPFREALAQRLRPHVFLNDTPRFGRRLGWYCLLRVAKPRLVVETGTADGFGTALLARGLERNAAEGSPGRILTFDLDPEAGWLLDEQLRTWVELVPGDSAETLPRALAGERIDFFVHDSDHSPEHERMELEFAVGHAADRMLLISDNAHATTELHDLCGRLGAPFRLFHEQPRRHFYPGAGIGLALMERPPS